MQRLPRFCALLSLTVMLAVAGTLPNAARAADAEARARVIVKLKPPTEAPGAARVVPLAERLNRAAVRHGAQPQAQRPLGGEVRLLTATGIDSATLARQLAADPEVAYAVPDRRMRRNVVPNDTLYGFRSGGDPEVGQWYLRSPDSLFRSAINAEAAWTPAVVQGSRSVVVAVLDTGVRFDHLDLGTKLLPGYDFIRDTVTAADGDGRDADASDPGDWVTGEEVQRSSTDDLTEDCLPRNEAGQLLDAESSWHGTKVAGMVGALTDNGEGIAGAGWDVRVLPVRVLGKCGGFESDIVVAMRWAAGMAVEGVPDNPAANRAKIVNLSLGGAGACRAAYADAVADLTALGVTVIASAGNTAGHVVSAPANCEGVIGVGGLRHIGTKVGFSDLGPEVAISAPGGNCMNTQPNEPCLYPLITTTNAGITTPAPASSVYTNGSTDITVGTSFSAPLVSGAAALMLAVQPGLTPDELRARLQATARTFPTTGAVSGTPQCTAPRFDNRGDPIDQLECYCTTETCGAGMLDARAAVQAALGIVARISLVGDGDPKAGEPLTLGTSDSLLPDGRSIAGVQWTLVEDGGIVDGFDTPANAPTVQLTPSAGGEFTVRVRVEDNEGDFAEQTVRVTVQGPSRDRGGGGGGGAMGVGYLLALLAALPAVRRAVQGPSKPARQSGRRALR
ncbi:MAG: S8 family serine peptidase [Methylibium sp.]|nr:S8 family serine peptidase [Methylibium sp.]